MRKRIFVWGIIVCSFLLGGCQFNRQANDTSKVNEGDRFKDVVTIADVLKGEHLLVVEQQKTLLVVDPDFPKPMPIYTLSDPEVPPRRDWQTFKLSASKRFVVWYSPQTGVMSLNIDTGKVESVYRPSEWFNSFPHLEMHPEKDLVYLVDDGGERLIKADLPTGKAEAYDIPFPFGTMFAVSPNLGHAIFVSGYGQGATQPQYMITEITGNNPQRFYTDTDQSDRHMVIWLPDSSAVAMVEMGNSIVAYMADDPEVNRLLWTAPEGERITRLERVNNYSYIQTNMGTWYVYDLMESKLIARTPLQVAEELNAPVFIPWFEKSFLIQETIRSDDHRYYRLWKSDFRGVKKMVIEKFGEELLETETPNV